MYSKKVGGSDVKQYLIFCLANQHYAIETTHVIQVAKEEKVAKLPFLAQPIKGLMMIRDCVIPIVDTMSKWEAKKSNPNKSKGHIIVMNLRGQILGYWVDEVIDIGFWREEELLSIAWSKKLDAKVWIHKVYSKEETLIGIIEPEAFEME